RVGHEALQEQDRSPSSPRRVGESSLRNHRQPSWRVWSPTRSGPAYGALHPKFGQKKPADGIPILVIERVHPSSFGAVEIRTWHATPAAHRPPSPPARAGSTPARLALLAGPRPRPCSSPAGP